MSSSFVIVIVIVIVICHSICAMRILSIETSCDETSLALVEASGSLRSPQFKIQKLLTASQIETHRPFGGVVPNLAKREHQINLPVLFKKLKFSTFNFQLIAVTVGPGLEPCLWQGIEFAKQIKKQYFPKAKIIGTNHLHGHMYSFLLASRCHPEPRLGWVKDPMGFFTSLRSVQNDIFPAIQLIASGGHTILLLMQSLTKYKKLGETRDDAAGEAFDKVARMLGLPYPGGPEIERLTRSVILNNPPIGGAAKDLIKFPRPMIHEKNYDFSFSGLKTSVLYYLRNLKLSTYNLQLKTAVATAFQEAVIDVLVTKTLRAAKEYGAKSVILSGGVAANSALQKEFKKRIHHCHSDPALGGEESLQFLCAPKKFQGDNAAMIAIAGYITYLRKKKYPLKARGSLEL
ncbi:MAG: tRNA (adenosine(37)-N6)-threonylcarbamoyltransferase complex transferase subunit TsaD [bacterium]|nr:tRNA (adenosine(37)-N6)-threonylcarbamoyltransferase complex transferase subunit TsaD [bacterium]